MSDSPFVLVLSDVNAPQLAMLQGVPHVVARNVEEASRPVREAEVIFLWAGTREMVRAAFIANPQVRWLHSKWAGVDSLLFPELVESDLPVSNSTGVFSESLGEFALAMVLYFAKDFPRMLRNKAARRWEQFDLDEIAGQTIGIVGYGDIGRSVARRVQPMGMKVLALKRHAPSAPDPLIDKFYKPAEMHAMLAQCDYVAVCAPLTPETHHMISDAEFAAMKSSAVIINVGRGPVVDQAAMVRSLTSGKLRGAGLDVFEQEPIPETDPVWDLENVFISPHTADHTRDWLEQTMRLFLAQYERFRSGAPLANIIDKHLGY